MNTLEHLKRVKSAARSTYWTLKWVLALSGVRFQSPVVILK